MAPRSLHQLRAARVEQAFAGLPGRFLGVRPGFAASYEVRLGDLGRTWKVLINDRGATVRSPSPGGADVVIGTDASTWIALREGRMSGLDAFSRRRLYAHGNLDLALGFEGLFELPGGRPPHLRVDEIKLRDLTLKCLSAGHGAEQVICLHGLGSDKSSFFKTVAALAGDYTVHAIDLPGFGSSSKPARGAYDAPFFARALVGLMDEMGIASAHLIGNSMGGRIAVEVGLEHPDRTSSLSLLAPALAFRRGREMAPLVKLLRPELASLPLPMHESLVKRQLWGMFARPDRLDPAAADIAAAEFLRNYRTRAGRVAFFAAMRNIYLDQPWGDRGMWTRLEGLDIPSTFIWGDRDRLVPAGFSRHVADVLPSARQVTLADCGHVPQVELPDQTNALILETIRSATPATEAIPARRSRLLGRLA